MKRDQAALRKAGAREKPDIPVDPATRFDRFLTWFKNNRFFSILMLAAVVITAVSQLFGSIAGLIESSRSLLHPGAERKIVQPMTIEPAPDRQTNDKVAKILSRFGSKGIGPGYFSDARLLQVDARGQIVVGEFTGKSRIQRFDAQGKFIAQWFAGELDVYQKDDAVTSMALGGTSLYLGTGDELYRHDLETGRRLGTMRPQDKDLQDVEAVASNPLGGIVTIWKMQPAGHRLVVYDASGRVVASASKRLELPDDVDSHFDPAIAVDGNGLIYVLDEAHSVVYQLTAAGGFSNRFGSQGEAPGQIAFAPNAIAVNGRGQVCVVDSNGLEVFDADGRFVERVVLPREKGDYESGEEAIQFDSAGNLWVLYSDRVIEMAMP